VRGDRIVPLDELLCEESTQAHDYLRRLGSHLAYDGIVVHREVRFGDPLTETLAAVERHGVQAVVLAGHEPRRSLFRATWGHRLLAQAIVPVVVLPHSSAPPPRARLQYGGAPV
jgi:hypothetical protein